MGATTHIGWTAATWNPWSGCTQVSPGCASCYMYAAMRRYGQDPAHIIRSKTTFRQPLTWKEAKRIFTCSWSDFFHTDADAWRDDAWDIICQTPHHTYQILTKRPERMAACLPKDWGDGWVNVWLGVSVENQRMADIRIPLLRQTPAARRFLSVEPLLEMIDLYRGGFSHLGMLHSPTCQQWPPIDWVIVGGESGAHRRPMNIAWLTKVVEDCRAEGVAVFVKQDSAFKPGQQGRIPDHLWALKQFPGNGGT